VQIIGRHAGLVQSENAFGRLVLAVCVLGIAGCAGGPPAAKPSAPEVEAQIVRTQPPKRVVLVTIDTLRADYVGSYGATQVKTPTLDRLARDGVRFETAISPAPITMVSHTSLMTALDPPMHGVHANGKFRLPDSIPTLAERFQQAGITTAGFVAAVVLDRRYGLDRGFDSYDDQMGYRRNIAGATGAYAERTADQMTDAVLAWLKTAPDEFFLWVHYYDPHGNYDPPKGFRPKTMPTLKDPKHADVLETASVMFPPLYAGEIYFVDTELGRMLRGIDNRFRDDDTLFVVTSDHGESLCEHGEITHTLTLYDATQRVPLLMEGAGLPAGRVVRAPVRLIDVAPTILEFAGLPALGGAAGVSLLPWVQGQRTDALTAYVETLETYLGYGWSPVLGLRTDRYKYLRTVRPELYDLARDPHELANLAEAEPAVVAEFDGQLEARLAGARPVEPNVVAQPEQAAMLESLGYAIADAGEPGKPVGWVGGEDPKDAISAFVLLLEARSQIATGHPQQALETLKDESAAGGWVALARSEIALALGDPATAERNARLMIDAQPHHAEGYIALGAALERRGEFPDAVLAYEEAARINPNETDARVALGRLAEASGRVDDAIAEYELALDSHAPNPDAALRLAAVYYERGMNDQAEALLEPVDSGHPDAIARLARAQAQAGFVEQAAARVRNAVQSHPDDAELEALRVELDGG